MPPPPLLWPIQKDLVARLCHPTLTHRTILRWRCMWQAFQDCGVRSNAAPRPKSRERPMLGEFERDAWCITTSDLRCMLRHGKLTSRAFLSSFILQLLPTTIINDQIITVPAKQPREEKNYDNKQEKSWPVSTHNIVPILIRNMLLILLTMFISWMQHSLRHEGK